MVLRASLGMYKFGLSIFPLFGGKDGEASIGNETKHMGDLLETGQSQGHESVSLTCPLWSIVALHPLLVLTEIPAVSYKGLFQWQVYSIPAFFSTFSTTKKILAVLCDGQVL